MPGSSQMRNSKLIRTPIFTAACVIAALAVAGCGSDSKDSPSKGIQTSKIDPSNFAARVDNAYFPLDPGTTLRYRGSEHGKVSIDEYTVTHKIKTILGVPNVVVHDKLFLDGRLAEDTDDWYTQDREGNVWYFGEDTKEVDRQGHTITKEGSWQAGVNGARPGIFMPARPQVGQSFKQESYKGHAEDYFRVTSLNASVRVPYGNFRGVLRTEEWSPLEPGVLDSKYYVRGIGQVKQVSVKGPREHSVLVQLKRR